MTSVHRRERLGAAGSRAGDRQAFEHGRRRQSQRLREIPDGAGPGQGRQRRRCLAAWRREMAVGMAMAQQMMTQSGGIMRPQATSRESRRRRRRQRPPPPPRPSCMTPAQVAQTAGRGRVRRAREPHHGGDLKGKQHRHAVARHASAAVDHVPAFLRPSDDLSGQRLRRGVLVALVVAGVRRGTAAVGFRERAGSARSVSPQAAAMALARPVRPRMTPRRRPTAVGRQALPERVDAARAVRRPRMKAGAGPGSNSAKCVDRALNIDRMPATRGQGSPSARANSCMLALPHRASRSAPARGTETVTLGARIRRQVARRRLS